MNKRSFSATGFFFFFFSFLKTKARFVFDGIFFLERNRTFMLLQDDYDDQKSMKSQRILPNLSHGQLN